LLGLPASVAYGMDTGMTEMRKITVEVPEDVLAMAQDLTGEGITETVRFALKKLASIRAQRELLKLRGKVKFSLSLDELREDRE
jgi:Arc/MetJ-type ribon-helix-helix transcriptional regulator